jgi:hypothetical protein
LHHDIRFRKITEKVMLTWSAWRLPLTNRAL